MAKGIMDRLKRIELKHVLIALVLFFFLTQFGLIPSMFAIKGVVTGPIPCSVAVSGTTETMTCYKPDGTTVTDCPKPECVGGFTMKERTDAKDCDTLTKEPDKSSCKLSDAWYNLQGDLATVKCVDINVEVKENLSTQTGVPTGWHQPVTGTTHGVLEVSPYCVMEYQQVSDWIKANPMVWIRQNIWLALGLLVVLIAVVVAFLPGKQQ